MDFSLNSIFQSLVPKDKKFVPLFIQASANVVACAQTLRDAFHSDSVSRIHAYKQIALLEQQGDEITHVIMREVASTFIIPFDREDIQSLAVAMDDIADYIYAVSKQMELYKIYQIDPAILKMSVLILEATQELDIVVNNLRDLRYTRSMQDSLAKIRERERQVEDVYGDAIAKLFREADAMEILKMKEVYSLLNLAADRVEETASVIQSVLVKFS